MPHSPRVKDLAYQLDPDCWISYSGKSPSFKRSVEARRCAALAKAQRIIDRSPVPEIKMPTATVTIDVVREAVRAAVKVAGKAVALKIIEAYGASVVVNLHPHHYADVLDDCRAALRAERENLMTPLKIKMMLHFATVLGPFAPEEVRTSPAYTMFVKELLHDGMIERPTREQRDTFKGWAYKATPKGQCYVKALTRVPLPVRTDPVWAMPV